MTIEFYMANVTDVFKGTMSSYVIFPIYKMTLNYLRLLIVYYYFLEEEIINNDVYDLRTI